MHILYFLCTVFLQHTLTVSSHIWCFWLFIYLFIYFLSPYAELSILWEKLLRAIKLGTKKVYEHNTKEQQALCKHTG